MAKETEQELEWLEAQKLEISVDLVTAAKQQLEFLAAVDRNRWLYEGPALQKAIYRYNACWLPLLAKNSESTIAEGPLVAPLDCEWIWHCHRLNPVRYKADCEELYGKVLDNFNVTSSVGGTSKKQSENIWKMLYPEEPYYLDLEKALSEDVSEKISTLEKCTKYDLISAVKRQSPFFYQVSRDHVNNDIFLEEAAARYKGFLYLIKRNKERSVNQFCVPTYDVDLMWHTHQLHPLSYCTDLKRAIGKVLEHDDTDSDRSKGKKLDNGFSKTTAQWVETFGRRYWKAGAMYRGKPPSPVATVPFLSNIPGKNLVAEEFENIIQFSELNFVEVLLEIVGVKNLPDGQKGNLFISFSKTQPDAFFNAKRRLTILSESGNKQVASFQCEPTGELLFELMSSSPSKLPVTKELKRLGFTSLSLEEVMFPLSKLSMEKWLELTPASGNVASDPICISVSFSFTPPARAPSELHLIRPRALLKGSCFFPVFGKVNRDKSTSVIDHRQAEVISLQMRVPAMERTKDKRRVIGITRSGETHTLAEFNGASWSLLDSKWCLKQINQTDINGPLFQLVANKMIKLFLGRKLDYEPKCSAKPRTERDFMTAIEFSSQHPYGKAAGLLDLKSGSVKATENWFILPGIVSAFILHNILKKEGHGGFTAEIKTDMIDGVPEKPNRIHHSNSHTNFTDSVQTELKLSNQHTANVINITPAKGNGGCGSGCGGECGNMVKDVAASGGCSSGCGGECGSISRNVTGSGGCGSGCGGECGNMVKNLTDSGGCGANCGGGCGGECGNMVKSGACGGCGGGCGGCGGGCGYMTRGSGFGDGCGSSRGAAYKSVTESGGCGGGECGGGCGSVMNSGEAASMGGPVPSNAVAT